MKRYFVYKNNALCGGIEVYPSTAALLRKAGYHLLPA